MDNFYIYSHIHNLHMNKTTYQRLVNQRCDDFVMLLTFYIAMIFFKKLKSKLNRDKVLIPSFLVYATGIIKIFDDKK